MEIVNKPQFGMIPFKILCCKLAFSDSDVKTDTPITKDIIANLLARINEENYSNGGIRIYIEVSEFLSIGADNRSSSIESRILIDSCNNNMEISNAAYVENVKATIGKLKRVLGIESSILLNFYYNENYVFYA